MENNKKDTFWSNETVRAYRKALKKKLNTPNCIAALSQLASGCILQT